MEIKKIYQDKKLLIGTKIKVQGWVRFNRSSKSIGFIELTDGTRLDGIQLVYKLENEEVFSKLSSISLFSVLEAEGQLIQNKNDIEILITNIIDIKKTEEDFPIGKKEHGLEFLREQSHLRVKTKMFQAIMKIRSTAAISIHEFFKKEGFFYVHTPIITGNDAEGAGESFLVSVKDGKFFDKQGTLTVSGQLHAEGFAQSLKKVYAFGPTFRAENSHTTRHASEFWMLEPEAVFCDYNEMMEIGWMMIKYIINKILEIHIDDLELLQKVNKDENLISYLQKISSSDIQKISYKKAIDILNKASKSGVEFKEKDIHFGIDLATEHEKFLAETHFDGPVYVYDYPAEIKSFYMYDNGDGTVRGFDLLIPKIGELIGGSQREDRYDVLMKVINSKGQNLSELNWYLNLRKNGYAKSSGFGLGFERLVMLLTGVENIRDVLPFPRTPGKLNF
ncbi:MAG: asparagine--tRNA ligase [Mycoplasmataceae bacterium]|nr:asparagine--tRNA ligase [Mycoplasmataceae bacterium]